MQKSFWWWQCSDRYIISLSPHLHSPFPTFSPSLISLVVSVDFKHHVYLLTRAKNNKQGKEGSTEVGGEGEEGGGRGEKGAERDLAES